MRKVLCYCAGILVTVFVLFEAIVMWVLLLPPDVFAMSYPATIQAKYDLLTTTNTPKIVILGGSNCAFGIDAYSLAEATGYPIINLGLHAGFGDLFISELAKANIREGDIVLLGYEYNWPEKDSFTTMDTGLVMLGIDSRIEMYRYVPVSQWRSILGYLFKHAAKKVSFEEPGGLYARDAFSEDGNQLMFDRIGSYDPEEPITVTVQADISSESLEYLREYKEYIEDHGASVYFISAVYAKDSIVNREDLPQLAANVEGLIGIPFISDPLAYEFDWNEMFDTMYHCNNTGQEHRTRLLIEDLERVGVVNAP